VPATEAVKRVPEICRTYCASTKQGFMDEISSPPMDMHQIHIRANLVESDTREAHHESCHLELQQGIQEKRSQDS
jgi:hypothetical protein